MATVAELIQANYVHRGVVWTPPNGRQLIVQPAHPSNYSVPGDGRYRGQKQNLCEIVHTPEEDADENEVTPNLFSRPNYGASTHAYGDNDGDVYGMVPFEYTAWAQGTPRTPWKDAKGATHPPLDRYVVKNRPYPDFFPRDESGKVLSFNQMGNSIEEEGRAASMAESFHVGGPQWDSLCSWTGWQMWVFNWDELRRICSHMQFSTWRSDPGPFVIQLFPKIHAEALNHCDEFERQAGGTPVLRQKPVDGATAPAAPAPDQSAIDAIQTRVDALEAWRQAVHEASRIHDN